MYTENFIPAWIYDQDKFGIYPYTNKKNKQMDKQTEETGNLQFNNNPIQNFWLEFKMSFFHIRNVYNIKPEVTHEF